MPSGGAGTGAGLGGAELVERGEELLGAAAAGDDFVAERLEGVGADVDLAGLVADVFGEVEGGLEGADARGETDPADGEPGERLEGGGGFTAAGSNGQISPMCNMHFLGRSVPEAY